MLHTAECPARGKARACRRAPGWRGLALAPHLAPAAVAPANGRIGQPAAHPRALSGPLPTHAGARRARARWIGGGYLGEDEALGVDAQDERVLAVGEVVGRGRGVLPLEVVVGQVDVVQGLVVQLGEVQQRRAAAVVGGVCAQDRTGVAGGSVHR